MIISRRASAFCCGVSRGCRIRPQEARPAGSADLCLFAAGGKLAGGKAADVQDRSRYIADRILSTQCVGRRDGIQSAANGAALMALEDQKSMHLQKLRDSRVHRFQRPIIALGRVRQRPLEKKDVK